MFETIPIPILVMIFGHFMNISYESTWHLDILPISEWLCKANAVRQTYWNVPPKQWTSFFLSTFCLVTTTVFWSLIKLSCRPKMGRSSGESPICPNLAKWQPDIFQSCSHCSNQRRIGALGLRLLLGPWAALGNKCTARWSIYNYGKLNDPSYIDYIIYIYHSPVSTQMKVKRHFNFHVISIDMWYL